MLPTAIVVNCDVDTTVAATPEVEEVVLLLKIGRFVTTELEMTVAELGTTAAGLEMTVAELELTAAEPGEADTEDVPPCGVSGTSTSVTLYTTE